MSKSTKTKHRCAACGALVRTNKAPVAPSTNLFHDHCKFRGPRRKGGVTNPSKRSVLIRQT